MAPVAIYLQVPGVCAFFNRRPADRQSDEQQTGEKGAEPASTCKRSRRPALAPTARDGGELLPKQISNFSLRQLLPPESSIKPSAWDLGTQCSATAASRSLISPTPCSFSSVFASLCLCLRLARGLDICASTCQPLTSRLHRPSIIAASHSLDCSRMPRVYQAAEPSIAYWWQ
jgi:hypothetical protein